jgi:hypothetical protein
MIDPPRCTSGKSMSPRFTRTTSREWNKYVSPAPFIISFYLSFSSPFSFFLLLFLIVDLTTTFTNETRTDGRYTKYVTKNTGQLETMLKVILAPDVSSLVLEPNERRANIQDPPEGFVQNYCLLIGDRSFSNFQKVRVIPSAQLFPLSHHIYLV